MGALESAKECHLDMSSSRVSFFSVDDFTCFLFFARCGWEEDFGFSLGRLFGLHDCDFTAASPATKEKDAKGLSFFVATFSFSLGEMIDDSSELRLPSRFFIVGLAMFSVSGSGYMPSLVLRTNPMPAFASPLLSLFEAIEFPPLWK